MTTRFAVPNGSLAQRVSVCLSAGEQPTRVCVCMLMSLFQPLRKAVDGDDGTAGVVIRHKGLRALAEN